VTENGFQKSYKQFFFDQVTANCKPAVADAIAQIYDWTQTMHGSVWGRGQCNPALHIIGRRRKVAYIAADGWAWPALGESQEKSRHSVRKIASGNW
jgi:hypothetical protein